MFPRHEVRLMEPGPVEIDPRGQRRPVSWMEHSVRVMRRWTRGGETEDAAAVQAEIEARYDVPWGPTARRVTPRWRLRDPQIEGREADILAVQPDPIGPAGSRRWVRLLVRFTEVAR